MDDNRLEELAHQERLEYFRKWRAAHKDKVRESNKRYWERKAARKLAAAEQEGQLKEMEDDDE